MLNADGCMNFLTIRKIQELINKEWYFIGDDVIDHLDKSDASESYLKSLESGVKTKNFNLIEFDSC